MTTPRAFKERVDAWATKLGVSSREVAIRPMKRKWASCGPSRLTFDTSLLSVAPEIQDYVIVHELLHVDVPNHGRLWKSLMRAHLGDYERSENALARFIDGSSVRASNPLADHSGSTRSDFSGPDR
jgi:predicted metal-dependent hydrolase